VSSARRPRRPLAPVNEGAASNRRSDEARIFISRAHHLRICTSRPVSKVDGRLLNIATFPSATRYSHLLTRKVALNSEIGLFVARWINQVCERRNHLGIKGWLAIRL
jgi:hypothetical protein